MVRMDARGLRGNVVMPRWRLESIVSLLNVHDISRGRSPLVARQFTTAVSPGLNGTSPKLNGIINGGTRTVKIYGKVFMFIFRIWLKGRKHKNGKFLFAPFTTKSVVCETMPAALFAVKLKSLACVASTDSMLNMLLWSVFGTNTNSRNRFGKLIIDSSVSKNRLIPLGYYTLKSKIISKKSWLWAGDERCNLRSNWNKVYLNDKIKSFYHRYMGLTVNN